MSKIKKDKFLAIDPGSRFMGFAVASTHPFRCYEVGVIQPNKELMEDRFQIIFEALMKITKEHDVKNFVVEKVFHHKNAQSAFKLAMARGIVYVVAGINQGKVFEISPNEVKKTTTGRGHASKEEVAEALKILTGISNLPTNDASDALAIAYAFSSRVGLNQIQGINL